MTRKRPPSSRVPRRHRAGRPAAAVAACLLAAMPAARAGESACPAFLATAETLLVVTARGMDAVPARLATFSRDAASGRWRRSGPEQTAVVGARGLAWGHPFRGAARGGEPVKTEGDRRTPAGIYRIGRSFGTAPSARPGHLVLRPGQAICVDDPASPAYNTIVTRVPGATPRGEDMGTEPFYRRGLVIDYPSDAGRRAGSCIFLHVWRGPGRGTAGCVALPEARVAALQDLSARGDTAIAILPEGAIDRFAACLPGLR